MRTNKPSLSTNKARHRTAPHVEGGGEGKGDNEVQSLVKISHDSHRRFGSNRYKLIGILPKAQAFTAEVKVVHTSRLLLFMVGLLLARRERHLTNTKPRAPLLALQEAVPVQVLHLAQVFVRVTVPAPPQTLSKWQNVRSIQAVCLFKRGFWQRFEGSHSISRKKRTLSPSKIA